MTFLLLLLFWIVLNGKVTLEIILVGVALSAAVNLLTVKLMPTTRNLGRRVIRLLPQVVLYLIYLVGQIILSNLQVIRLILKPTPGRPKLVWFRPNLKHSSSMLVLANSITLTPGTATVGMGDDTICVYAIRPEFSVGLEVSGFGQRLHELEGKEHG